MPLPQITIVFKTLGITAIQRSQKGTVAMILTDTKHLGGNEITNVNDIPKDLSVPNKEQMELAFLGYQTPPRKVMFYVMDGTTTTLTDALRFYETEQFDYLVPPPDVTAGDVETIASWVKSERLRDHTAKAVLPNTDADSEAIINFTSSGMKKGETEYTTEEYTARIAGLIAGTPMKISCTYAPLPELTDVERLTKDELDTAIDAGEFVLFHDGEKVKVGRGVNSFVTMSQGKGAAFQKIKIVEVMDMIKNDIRLTAQDHYIGKYANSYDNKCLLIMAIKGYLEQLELEELLEKGTSQVAINLEKQEAYLKSKGIDTSEMTEQEIKEANTDSIVFLRASIRILDAIEDIDLEIAI